jgi:hypothetical protein
MRRLGASVAAPLRGLGCRRGRPLGLEQEAAVTDRQITPWWVLLGIALLAVMFLVTIAWLGWPASLILHLCALYGRAQ